MTDLRPVVTSAADVDARPFLQTVHRLLISAGQTGGALSMLDAGLVPAGFSPPRHTHHREHELFTVVSGAVRFESGESTQVVEGSGAAWLPAGRPHSFEVISAARMYVVTVPSGSAEAGDYERFTEAVSAATQDPTLQGDELAAVVAQVSAAHSISIVGPPLRSPRRPLRVVKARSTS